MAKASRQATHAGLEACDGMETLLKASLAHPLLLQELVLPTGRIEWR